MFGFIDKSKSFLGQAYRGVKTIINKVVNKLVHIGKNAHDYAKHGITRLNTISHATVERYGNDEIQSMYVARKPVKSITPNILNLISKGKFSEIVNKYGYDNLFHLQLVCNVKHHNILLEKNHVININSNFQNTSETEIMPIQLNKQLTINEMLNRTLEAVGNDRFYHYSAFKFNCQQFITDVLTNNGLMTQELQTFIHQNVEAIKEELTESSPHIPTALNAITDVAGALDTILNSP